MKLVYIQYLNYMKGVFYGDFINFGYTKENSMGRADIQISPTIELAIAATFPRGPSKRGCGIRSKEESLF